MLERDVLLLKKVLETSNTQQMVQLPRAKSQMVDVMLQISGKVVHGTAAEHYIKYKSVHEYLQQHMPTGMIEKFEKLVIEPVVEWIAYLAEVRGEQSEFEKVRIAFDHYRDKMSTLVEQKRQMQIKGKVVDKATDEKLTRNLEKLQQSETAYQESRDRFVGRMLRCFEDANHRLDNVLLRVMQYETAVSTDIEKSIAAFKPHTSILSTTVRDRRAIASPTEQLGWCVEKARNARQNGTKLDLEKFILKDGTGPASGAAPSSSFVPSISRARSGSQTLRDEEEAAAAAAPVVSMSAFTSGGASKSADASRPVAAARPPPSVGNPFGGTSASSSSTEEKPPLPVRRGAASAAPEPAPSAPAPAAAKGGLFGGWGNPFGAAKTEPTTGAFELGDGDETPRKPAGSRGRTDEDPTPDPNFTRELETPAPAPAPSFVQPSKTGRAHTSTSTSAVPSASTSNNWDGGFGDSSVSKSQTNSLTNVGGSGAAASASSFDPWGGGGGFGSAPTPAPAPVVANANSGFGDFGFDAAPIASTRSAPPLNPLNPFASPPPATKPAAAAAASWDDFGSFGAPAPAASKPTAVDPNDPFGSL
jgi:hypothetical protein